LERYGKSNEALESCNRLIKIHPNDTNGLLQRAHLYSMKNDWENSLIDLNKAKLYKKDKEYLFNDIGYAYQSLKNFENAKLYYDKSSLENSEFLNPIYNNALLHLKIEKYLLALDYIHKCFIIKDNVPQFHKTKGEILIKLQRKEEGIVYLKKAKKMGDKDAKKIIKENK
jgi:tetratricopeptide (TPR) repeat protein